jgi:hypothetical protein
MAAGLAHQLHLFFLRVLVGLSAAYGGEIMKAEAQISPPEMALVIGTRAALGVGLGFLLGNCFSEEQRRVAGWTLLLSGAFVATTLGWELFGHPRSITFRIGKNDSQHGQHELGSGSQDRLSRLDAVRVG